MAKGPGRLLVLESLLEEGDHAGIAAMFDLNMLAITGGQERTRQHYEELFAQAGFTLQEVHLSAETPLAVMECAPVS